MHAITEKEMEQCVRTVQQIALQHCKPGHSLFDDLISDGMLGIVEARDRYDPAKSKFTTFAHWHIWGRIKKRMTASRYQEYKTRKLKSGLQRKTRKAKEPEFIQDEAAAVILSTLPPQTKEVMELRYVLNYSREEIAERLGLSLNNVKWQLVHGVKLLKKEKGL